MDNNEQVLRELAALRAEVQALNTSVSILSGLTRALVNNVADTQSILIDKTLDAYIERPTQDVCTPTDTRAYSALHFAGIYTFRDLSMASKRDIARCRNVGKGTLGVICNLAKARDITFNTEENDGLLENVGVGTPVMLRITPQAWQSEYSHVVAGDIVTVIDIHPIQRKQFYRFANYTCIDNNNKKLYLSAGQIAPITFRL